MITRRRRASLVAPSSDERKARKALDSVADEVVLDLEDAVTPDRKDEARGNAVALAREYGGRRAVSVRVNGRTTRWFQADLDAVMQVSEMVSSIVLPKVETVADLEAVDRHLARSGGGILGVQALIETARGVQNVAEIAAGQRVEALILGYADLGAELGRSSAVQPEQWLYVQDRLLHASRAAGVQAVDGPFLRTADDLQFQRAARWAADLGFDGKWVIHPDQLSSALDIFTPSSTEIENAHRVLEALDHAAVNGSGAALLDGHMLDEAVAVAARRTLTKIGH